MRAARLVSCKVTLAARVDSFHESPKGETGKFLLGEIERRLEKLQEPPPVKAIKPLIAPIDSGKTKRGGRRARKMKERLGMTELSKQKNRTIFGEVRHLNTLPLILLLLLLLLLLRVQIEEDAYQDAVGFSYGAIGKSGSGRIRTAQVDSKTKAKISQKLQVRQFTFLFLSLRLTLSTSENVATSKQYLRRNNDSAQ